ncbi:MAG: glycosyltransferase family 39 protein [Chloroflexota bacterium]
MISTPRTRSRAKKAPFSDLLWLAIIGLLLQAIWAWRLTHPSYFDAYYYATNGQRLAAGYGFTEEVIWQFLDDPSGLPLPSHSYWMPLPSMLAAAGYTLVDSFRAAQLPFWFLSSLLPLFSYKLSWRLSGVRWQAWTAALLTASGGFYNTFWSQPSTFAPFAWLGAGCLWLMATALQTKRQRDWFFVGVLAGLAHLTRADGILLLMVAGWLWFVDTCMTRWRDSSSDGTSSTRNMQHATNNLVAPLLLLLGYLIVMGGWFWRNWLVFGRPLSTAGTQTIFLTSYDDLFAYGRTMTAADYFAWGWDNILWSKLVALSEAGLLLAAVLSLIFLTPFVIWGGWRWRKRPLLRPFFWYGTLLILAMTLLFTFPAGRGSLLHSSVSLWPWFMVLAAAGVNEAIEWRNRRWPPPNPEQTKRVYAGIFVTLALVTTLTIGWLRTPDSGHVQLFRQIGAELPETAVVMVGNAPGFYYQTGLPAVTVPNEPPDVLLQAAERYGVTHLVLDRDTPWPLLELYQGEAQAVQIELLTTVEDANLYALRYE